MVRQERSFSWCCKILQISENASESDIKTSYRRLVKLHHPDMGGKADAFRDIQEAYEKIFDLRKFYLLRRSGSYRHAYDATGRPEDDPNWKRQHARHKTYDEMVAEARRNRRNYSEKDDFATRFERKYGKPPTQEDWEEYGFEVNRFKTFEEFWAIFTRIKDYWK